MRRSAVLALGLILGSGCPATPGADDTAPLAPPSGQPAGGTPSGDPTTGPQSACAQAGFEAPTTGLSGPQLWDQLHDLTVDLSCDDYLQATIYLFTRLDKVNDEVECVYTGQTTPVTTTKPAEDVMNTEHSWPQSEGADVYPARCDLHHLYPTDSDANATRGSFPFGEVTGNPSWEQGGSRLGQSASGTTVFEPRDAHKGNVARSMLYFAFRYDKALSADQVALFQAWSQADPPDAAEEARTLDIGERQGVANPLVLCPELVDRL